MGPVASGEGGPKSGVQIAHGICLARPGGNMTGFALHEFATGAKWVMESYDKPVAFLHGDTHTFRMDQPLFSKKTNRRFENFTRVETFGAPSGKIS